jgi:hypothetical protein
MKRILGLTSVVLALVVMMAPPAVGQVSITIDNIVANGFITGHVKGLNPSQYGNYRVLVYVHTDKWYIHPYAQGGEGRSFASIGAGGSWRIGTVRRRFKADSLAALLVHRNYPAPPTVMTLADLQFSAIKVMALVGTKYYGRL